MDIAIASLPSFSIEYSLEFTSSGICITCTFLDSSATDCVAVVHQRISQLNSSGLMNIESSHKFPRSGDTTSGCIEAVNMDDYQVGVLEGRQVQPVMTGMIGTITIKLVSYVYLGCYFEITILRILILIITDSSLCIGCIVGSGNYFSP